jgi:hypothetical protein
VIACALVASAWALAPYDDLEMTLLGGTTVDGEFLRPASEQALSLLVDGAIVTVELGLLQSVKVNGAAQDLAPFRAEVAEAWAARLRPDPRPHPLPAVALGSSILFAGTGQALLGEGPEFRGYALLQVVCLSMEAVAVFYTEDAGLLVAVGALDLGLRGLSGVSAYRTARFRRQHAAGADR